jgi:hypothetical protein
MRPTWAAGAIVAVAMGVVVLASGIFNPKEAVSLVLLLVGLWTIIFAFTLAERKDRNYYVGWGAVLAALSLFDLLPMNYAYVLIILAIVALIIINVYIGKTPKIYTAATNPPPAGGGTPAAKD